MNTYQTVLLERDGHLGVVTINRPKQLNALNSTVFAELERAIGELTGGPDPVRALILTGSGEKAFVAGADIAEMLPMTAWAAHKFAGLGHSATALLESLPCATIAAINGYALGGGLELAMGCDLLYASENAKLGQPETNLGAVPGFGGTQRLSRLVGKARAKEMIFTGEMIDASKAQEIGLVLEVLPREQLLPHCRSVAAKIAAKGPLAIAEAKRLIERGYDLPLGAANRMEQESFGLLFDTADRREGMQAFLEKRPAVFHGK